MSTRMRISTADPMNSGLLRRSSQASLHRLAGLPDASAVSASSGPVGVITS